MVSLSYLQGYSILSRLAFDRVSFHQTCEKVKRCRAVEVGVGALVVIWCYICGVVSSVAPNVSFPNPRTRTPDPKLPDDLVNHHVRNRILKPPAENPGSEYSS